MLKLTQKKWADFFRQSPETGMGYWICSVNLTDGRRYDRVVVVGGVVTSVDGLNEIPFTESDIAEFVVTHDKSALRRS
jgi:hypothetical protein